MKKFDTFNSIFILLCLLLLGFVYLNNRMVQAKTEGKPYIIKMSLNEEKK